jgi:HEAT repeat protein
VPALISALKSDDYRVVDVAADCLGLLGRRAQDAVRPFIEAMTRDFDED